MTFNQLVMAIVQLLTETKYILSADLEQSKSQNHRKLYGVQLILYFFRYTEMWSLDGESKNIELAQPELGAYYRYPELVLVDINFCVKP